MTDHSSDTVASVVGSAKGAKQYRPYPAYKDTGVEWLGKIPTNWDVKENRWLFRDSDARSEYGEEELLTVSHISGVTRRADKPEVTMMEAASHEGYKLCGRGDLAINTMWAWMGALGVAREDGMVSPSYNVYRTISDELVPSYYDYLCRVPTHIIEITRNSKGIWSSRLRLYPDTFRNIQTPVPPKSEQRRISDFLDRTTAKIDGLVAKKERLIELLQEKRAALITRAVTKGLAPDVPMKDSGVDWLGEIPSYWEMKRVAELALSLQTGPFGSQLHAADYITGGVPVINPANLISGTLVPDLDRTVDEPTASRLGFHKLLQGDILFARRGDVGRCSLVGKQHEGWLCGTGCLRMRPCPNSAESSYLVNLLSTQGVGDWLGNESVGSTMQNLNTSIIGRIPAAIPGLAEQRRISEFLDRETTKIDTLVAKVREAIDRLKELRIALISAAVTGKIDVRKAVP